MIIRVVPESHVSIPAYLILLNKSYVLFSEICELKRLNPRSPQIKVKEAELGRLDISRKRIQYIQPAQKFRIIRAVRPDVIFLEFEEMLTPSQIKVLRSRGLPVYVIDDMNLQAEWVNAVKKRDVGAEALKKEMQKENSGRGANISVAYRLKKDIEKFIALSNKLAMLRSKAMWHNMSRLIHIYNFQRPLAFMGAAHEKHLKWRHPFTIRAIYKSAWSEVPA